MDGRMILSRPVSNKERNQKVTSLYMLNQKPRCHQQDLEDQPSGLPRKISHFPLGAG